MDADDESPELLRGRGLVMKSSIFAHPFALKKAEERPKGD
jgi:hypothetical protein